MGGISIQQNVETQGQDAIPSDAQMAATAREIRSAIGHGKVVRAKVLSTEGRYGDPERAFDVEVEGRSGFDPSRLWRKMVEIAHRSNQDSVFLSRALRPDENLDYRRHRPGIEVRFDGVRSEAEVQAVLDGIAAAGLEFYTVVVDPSDRAAARSGAMPGIVGVRMQYVPEFDARYGDGSMANMRDVDIVRMMKGKAHELARLRQQLQQVGGVATADMVWYETQVRFRNEYKEITDADAAGRAEAPAGADRGGVWTGRSIAEGLRSADRQRLEAERADDGAVPDRDEAEPHASRRPGSAVLGSERARDGSGRVSSRGLAPLEGAPRVRGASGPDPRLVEVAERYARENGIALRRQGEFVKVDEERARRLAQAYADMPHAPQDPAVREAYADLIRQTTAQYRALEEAGYQFYFVDLANDPYADQPGGFGNPWNAMRDLRANQRMAVYPTDDGFGSSELDVSDNPLLVDTGIEWGFGSPEGPRRRVTANDLFRAVHDAFGHGIEGAGFRADGEENAWQAHVRLFTGPAVGALTSETRGQNSWLNYGPHGEANRTAKVEDTIFADQKTGLMPEWTWEEGRARDAEPRASRKTTPPAERVIAEYGRGVGDVEVSLEVDDDTTLLLHSIDANPRGQGLGSLALNRITDLADKHGVTISLDVTGDDVTSDRLVDWYKRNGFEIVSDTTDNLGLRWRAMAREPRQLSRLRAPKTEAFKRWFKGSKVVDEQGEPLVVYHGTLSDFDSFGRARSNPESDLGAGFYFSSDPRDVGQNYSSALGPDMRNRIDREVERLNMEASARGEEYRPGDPETERRARENLGLTHHGAVLPVFLRMRKPVVLGNVAGGPKSRRATELTGEQVTKMLDFIEREYGDVDGLDIVMLNEDMAGHMFPGETTTANGIIQSMKGSDGLNMTEDGDGRNLANEIIRRAFQHLGFDGFIDHTVYSKFAWRQARISGARIKGMEGLTPQTTHYVVFEPEQIKSALGNRGTFDPKDADIRASRRGYPRTQLPNPFRTFEARTTREILATFNWKALGDAEDWSDLYWNARKTLQDQNAPVIRQVREAAGDAQLPDSMDPLLQLELYRGVGTEVQAFYEERTRPIVRAMKDAGISLELMKDYLFARHVPERNQQIAKLYRDRPAHQFARAARDPKVIGGSGYSTEWATRKMAELKRDPKIREIETIAAQLDKLNEERLDRLVAAGWLSQEEVDARRQAYKHYVPMRGWEGVENEDPYGPSRGFDMRGRERRALGRTSEAEEPIAHIFQMGVNAIVQAEKAKVAQAMLDFVRAHPNPNAWEINKRELTPRLGTRTVTVIDPATGLPMKQRYEVVRDVNEPPSRLDDNVFIVKEKGEDVYITFRNRDIATALRNLDPQSMNVFVSGVARITRTLAAMNTSWNAEWMIPNLFRDLTAAGLQITDANKKGIARKLLRNYVPAMRGALMHNMGRHNSRWAQIAREFEKAGGRVSYIEFKTVEEMRDMIREDLDGIHLVRRMGRKVFDTIEIFTQAAENGTRIAAFQAAREAGLSDARAAQIARNVTVDFNKKGTLSPTINAGWMFFNAAVQGNVRMITSVMRSRFTRRALGGLVVIGLLEALLGTGDEDEYREGIQFWERDRNLVLMLKPLGLGETGEYVKIPLPYGFNVFKTLGSELGRMLLHDAPPAEAAMNIVHSALNSFNPIGGEDFVNMVAPTLLDPITDVATNQTFTGSTVFPDYPGDRRPDHQLAYPDVAPWAEALTRWLNHASGGDEFRAGAISVSPETLEHVVGSYLGGVGRLADNIITSGSAWVAGEEAPPHKVPFRRQVYGETLAELPTILAYKTLSDRVLQLDWEIKELQEAGKPREALDARRRDPYLARLIPMVKDAESQLRRLRTQERAAREQKGLSDDAREERIQRLEEQAHTVRRRLLERARRMRD